MTMREMRKARRIGAVLGFDWTLLFKDMDGESNGKGN